MDFYASDSLLFVQCCLTLYKMCFRNLRLLILLPWKVMATWRCLPMSVSLFDNTFFYDSKAEFHFVCLVHLILLWLLVPVSYNWMLWHSDDSDVLFSYWEYMAMFLHMSLLHHIFFWLWNEFSLFFFSFNSCVIQLDVVTFILFPDKDNCLFYCSCAIYHKNLFGKNQKLNLSLERGQIDSIFRINYTDPWIEGDDKRTSRSIMVQVAEICAFCLKWYFLLKLISFWSL